MLYPKVLWEILSFKSFLVLLHERAFYAQLKVVQSNIFRDKSTPLYCYFLTLVWNTII